MHRLDLINYRSVAVTPDTAAALREVEKNAIQKGRWLFDLHGPHKNLGRFGFSLIPAGREVHFRLSREDVTSRNVEMAAMWGIAVPLGFTPLHRHCIPAQKPLDFVFHFLGVWQSLYDRLLAEGRGHLAWSSVCCAAQVDVGTWGGSKKLERFEQAQLHRIGHNIGPLDGVIGPKCSAALQMLKVKGTLQEQAEYLKDAKVLQQVPTGKLLRGHLTLPGRHMRVTAYGSATAQQAAPDGAILTATGPGRFIVDIGDLI